jgi:NAD(P)-dependent dehydrogenase (short-subunit alcohol dehydrogenase family)
MQFKHVALITGANQGIGLQIARELAAEEFTVLVGSRDLARGIEAARSIRGDACAIQLDVTDRVSVAEAAKRIRDEFGRLDVLVQNAAISNIRKTQLGLTMQDSAGMMVASMISLDEVRAIWDTNVFGVLAVYQAMLPLLRAAPAARIVNVSSGVGSLTRNSDPAYPYRKIFTPGYSASKTALNAMTVAMAIELEGTPIKVNCVSPGFTKTNLNGYEGTETVEQGAAEAVRMALLGADGPSGTFTHATLGVIPW